jgi:hypothetical protein
MSEEKKPFYLVLDANAWISERMLHSSAGEAVLYAVAAHESSITFPKIVKIEVERVLRKFVDKAIGICNAMLRY